MKASEKVKASWKGSIIKINCFWSFNHHHLSKCSLICLKIDDYMHIYLPRSSLFNISLICVRVTLIRWFRSMLFKSHFHQVLDFSIHHLLIFIKSPRSRFRWSFLKFFILTRNFLVCQRVYAKSGSKRDRFLMFCSNRLIFIKFTNSRIIIFWFSSSSHALDLDDRFWNFSYWRGIFLYVSVCMRNRHLVMIVSLIESSDDRESYRSSTRSEIDRDFQLIMRSYRWSYS